MLLSPVLISAVALLFLIFLLLMRPRRFYFVRHGETLMNAEHVRQGEGGGLSERGKHQAHRVGKALQHLPIDRIISSTYLRARETATIINSYVKVSVVYSPLLVERRNPTEIIGKPTRDPEVTRIVDQMDLAYHDDDYRFSDEENFIDLRNRARRCLAFLARQGTRETVVVTHHHFLKMMIAFLLYRERLHANDFVKLSFYNFSDNAGITVCEYHPWRMFSETHGWEVLSFNQQP
jgi:broad specificity phosphatase PhoE